MWHKLVFQDGPAADEVGHREIADSRDGRPDGQGGVSGGLPGLAARIAPAAHAGGGDHALGWVNGGSPRRDRALVISARSARIPEGGLPRVISRRNPTC